MKNEMQVFRNEEFGEIRSAVVNGEPYFVGKDIAERLGYTDTNQAIRKHVDEDDKLTRRFDGSGQNREMTIINESGLYSLILSSKLPTAKAFKRWVTSEVLPSIRKTGSYKTSLAPSNREEIMLMNAKTRMANMFLKLSDVETLSKEYKNILVAKASQVLAGEELIPLPKSERKVYSAAEIGEILGISANMVGRLANANNLKTGEYGQWRRSKSEHSSKEVDTFMYYSETIEPLRNLIPVREVK
ncbi:MAG: BRO family protein [Peptostreptococcaceae bacterium]|nr:BRO family protein [Peptostreptococcaceae bacterium]